MTDYSISTETELDVFINKFHYDNKGQDINEKIEIANPTKKNLEGYKIFLYNGVNGSLYSNDYIALPNTKDKFHVITTDTLQNGAPDGIALVGPDGTPLQFISYEGEFVAQDGPLVGFTSENINVSENLNTPENYSLQLKGIGNYYTDFSWEGSIEHTFGKINRNQLFSKKRPTIPYNSDKDMMFIIDLDVMNDCIKIDETKTINYHTPWYTFNEASLNFAELARNNKLKVESADSVNILLSKFNKKRLAIWKAVNNDEINGRVAEELLGGDKNLRIIKRINIENAIAMSDKVPNYINAGSFNKFSVTLKLKPITSDKILNAEIYHLFLNENRKIPTDNKIFYHNDMFVSTSIHSLNIKLKESITPALKEILHVENETIILTQTNTSNDRYEPQSINNSNTGKIFILCQQNLGNRILL